MYVYVDLKKEDITQRDLEKDVCVRHFSVLTSEY